MSRWRRQQRRRSNRAKRAELAWAEWRAAVEEHAVRSYPAHVIAEINRPSRLLQVLSLRPDVTTNASAVSSG